jgi:hypothetical protein
MVWGYRYYLHANKGENFLKFCEHYLALISTVLWLLYDFLFLKKDVNVPSQRNKHKNSERKKIFYWHLDVHWRKGQDPEPDRHPDPEPLIKDTDPRIRIRTKVSRFRNTDLLTILLYRAAWPYREWFLGLVDEPLLDVHVPRAHDLLVNADQSGSEILTHRSIFGNGKYQIFTRKKDPKDEETNV